MTPFRKQAVLFDLDGTLIDSLQDLCDSGNAVLAARGLPTHDREAYRTFVGNGMRNLVQDIFPEEQRPKSEEEIDAALNEYRDAYAERWKNTTAPYPGIAELLDRLSTEKVPIGVVSNKAQDFTEQCVSTFLARWEWQVVIGAREGIPPKPDPRGALDAARTLDRDPSLCLFVGDSNVDILTAKAAGMRAVGVSWGFRGVEELLASGAECILESPADLFNCLE